MSIIVSNCQQCDEQQFQTLSYVHYTFFPVVKLGLFIRALLLGRILALKKIRTRLAYILLLKSAHPRACTSDGRLYIKNNLLDLELFLWYFFPEQESDPVTVLSRMNKPSFTTVTIV